MWFFIILIIFVIIYYINSQKDVPVKKPTKVETTPPISTKKNLSSFTHINSFIAGIPHRFGSEVDLNIIVRQRATLIAQRELDNPHDKNAIRLYSGKVFIGFVPKLDNLVIANHIDSGGSVVVTVTNIDPTDKWHGVKISIKLI